MNKALQYINNRFLRESGTHWDLFGNFGLEIQTWESTSAFMSLVDSHLVPHYIIKVLAHFAKEMVTNK